MEFKVIKEKKNYYIQSKLSKDKNFIYCIRRDEKTYKATLMKLDYKNDFKICKKFNIPDKILNPSIILSNDETFIILESSRSSFLIIDTTDFESKNNFHVKGMDGIIGLSKDDKYIYGHSMYYWELIRLDLNNGKIEFFETNCSKEQPYLELSMVKNNVLSFVLNNEIYKTNLKTMETKKMNVDLSLIINYDDDVEFLDINHLIVSKEHEFLIFNIKTKKIIHKIKGWLRSTYNQYIFYYVKGLGMYCMNLKNSKNVKISDFDMPSFHVISRLTSKKLLLKNFINSKTNFYTLA